MDLEKLRLECLQIASRFGGSPEEVVRVAGILYDWVIGKAA
jgi:hypothetical protein